MKYIFSNGLKLEIREVGEIIYQLEIKGKDNPLPIVLKGIISDEKAREVCKQISETRKYKRTK